MKTKKAFTLIYSDTEGWPRIERFNSEKEADAWVKKNLRKPDWWNPAPQLIIGPKHQIKEYRGFEY
jgi:hypothetical protein